ncbi:MAG: Fe-S cluster assembly protein SufD [Anaerolineae bacterium]|nr:MAG: Fe-S cluster assembly protein SufD [Anaerolineae bacterium]
MASQTRKIVRTARRRSALSTNFSFTESMIPAAHGAAAAYRQQAWQHFQRLPMPATSDEAWRRTDLRRLDPARFHLPTLEEAAALPPVPETLLQPLVDAEHGGQMVFTAAGVRTSLATDIAAQGVVFVDLATAERAYPEILEKIRGQVVRPEEGKFAALSAALAHQGVLIYVPRNVQVAAPLHSILWGAGQNLACFSHVLVYLEEGAALTYVHEWASPEDAELLHAGTVELHVGPNAHLRYVELQSWGQRTWNFTHERARVLRNGKLDWIFGLLGSRLTKTFADLDLVEDGAEGRMSGFSFTNDSQHLDYDTQQNHLAPHTTSDLLFKTALEDRSRSVWQGMIYVAPGAQKTDGYQANRNLLLSRQARADSIPGLEILADDVRCTHGATAGKVDPDQLFYLRSRGIPEKEAERLIVEGFFTPVMDRIPFAGVRARFEQAIQEKMH